MHTLPASNSDDLDFTDEEIQESIAPYLAEVDADYAVQFDALKAVFEAKGPE